MRSKNREMYSWKKIRKHTGMSKMMFADYIEMGRSNYSRKETYERGMSAQDVRMLCGKFEFLNVHNLILTKEELDEYNNRMGE